MARRPLALLSLVVTTFVGLAACDEGEERTRGLDQPIRVIGGELHAGELPGSPPVEDEALRVSPLITALDNANGQLRPSQVGKVLSGRASPETFSIGLRFPTIGTGYWVIPVGNADPLQNNEVSWETTSEIGATITPGLLPMRVVAIDGQGKAGTQREIQFCVASPVPDNLNACSPTSKPPYAVFGLRWDTNVDLDLQVRVPNGKLVWSKNPSSAPLVDGKIDPATLASKSTGNLDRDSNGSCLIDGVRREHLVFEEKPDPGLYQVHVGLFSPCGETSVRFEVSLYLREDLPDGTFRQNLVLTQPGSLTAETAGVPAPGLFVTELLLK